MGAPPELPNEADVRPSMIHLRDQPLQNEDNGENEIWAAGYVPLGQLDLEENEGMVHVANDNNEYSDDGEDYQPAADNSVIIENTNENVVNVPPIESMDVQLMQQVWNEPRPKELQIELDTNKTQQILSVMSHIKLPNLATPEWAAGIPEERWKDELLQRIRQHKDGTLPSTSTFSASSNPAPK